MTGSVDQDQTQQNAGLRVYNISPLDTSTKLIVKWTCSNFRPGMVRSQAVPIFRVDMIFPFCLYFLLSSVYEVLVFARDFKNPMKQNQQDSVV